MKNSLRIFLFFFVAFISISPAFSSTWTGSGIDNLASTVTNWTGNAMPLYGDAVIFDGTSGKDCTWDLENTFSSLAIDGYTGTVTISATLTISSDFVPPEAPSGLSATAISSSRIDLSWADNANTESGFKIERKTGTNGAYSEIGTVGVNMTSYSDTDPSLSPATTYYYRVRAYNISGNSAYSDEASATTMAAAPSATTNPVSHNTGKTATLNATVNPNGLETSMHFEWGTTTSYGNTTSTQIIPAGTSAIAITADIVGLTVNTTYHYSIVAINAIGTTNGSDVPFTTPVIAPSATTNQASSVAGNSATLNGTVNPNGLQTSVYFEWGTDTSYGNTTTTQVLPAGVNDIAVTSNISGLTVNTTFHYRAVAVNSVGTTYGADVIFTTPSHAPPLALTEPATNKNGNSATMNATVNPNGLQTSVYFEWGLTTAYGNTTSVQSLSADIDNISMAANITGLPTNTTYHYRVVATNADGTTNVSDMTFTTSSITITITSPTDGSAINRPDIMVTGTLASTGNETGVTVNGIVGMVYNNQFAVNHVPLADEANTISVTATDTAGNTATTAITINADTSLSHVSLTANPESGVAPLTAYFTVSTAIPNSAATYAIDFDGDATVDYTGASFDNISYAYSAPGIYYAGITVTDNQMNAYADTIAVMVLNMTDLDALLRAKWNAMKAALTNRDVSGAVRHYTAETKQLYTDIYNADCSEYAGHPACLHRRKKR
jgi:hypothetical protein